MPRALCSALVAWAIAPCFALAQTGDLSGIVVDRVTGHPLPRAQVAVTLELDGKLEVRSTAASDSGAFAISDVPWGRVVLSARRVGYAPAETVVDFRGDATAVQVRLEPVPVALSEIVVDARVVQRTLRDNGFYDRAEFYRGIFLDRAAIDRRKANDLSSLLAPYMTGCSTLYVNGSRVLARDRIVLAEVVGVEVYFNKAATPIEYQNPSRSGGPRCRTILVWTSVRAGAER